MNNVNSSPCGCGNCEPACTECGRPWTVCKGECKKCRCKDIKFCEYGCKAPGCIRNTEPGCPMHAVIPSVVVEDVSGLKNLADCFVHVTNINTTFYIDDKHRTMITWAGPVEYNNYDVEGNPLGLRGQFLVDPTNHITVYYDKTGRAVTVGGSTPTPEPEPTRIWIPSEYYRAENARWICIRDREDMRSYIDGTITIYSTEVMWQKEDGTLLSNAQVYRAMQNGEKFALSFALNHVIDDAELPDGAYEGLFYPPDANPRDLVIPGQLLLSTDQGPSGEINPDGDNMFTAVYGAYSHNSYLSTGATALTAGFRFHDDQGQDTAEFFVTLPGSIEWS